MGRQNVTETHETMSRSNEEVAQMHMQRRQAQEEDLDDILKGVKRINNITYDINTELERQDVIIDEIGDKMDTAKSKAAAASWPYSSYALLHSSFGTWRDSLCLSVSLSISTRYRVCTL